MNTTVNTSFATMTLMMTDTITKGSNGTAPKVEPLATPGIVIQASIMSLFSVFGCLGNLLTIIVILKFKNLQTATDIFIANLAISDFLICSVTIPMYVICIVKQTWPFSDKVCWFVGELTIVLCHTSVFSLTSIAVNRYFVMRRPARARQYFTTRNTLLICMGLWLASILTALPPLFGWGAIFYQEEISFCLVKIDFHDNSYLLFLTVMCGVLPMIIMSLSYSCIYCKIHQVTANFRRSIESSSVARENSTANGNIASKSGQNGTDQQGVNHGQRQITNESISKSVLLPLSYQHSNMPSCSSDGHVMAELNSNGVTSVTKDNNGRLFVKRHKTTAQNNGLNARQNKLIQSRMNREHTVMVNVLIVTLIFGLCWLPLGFTSLVASHIPISRYFVLIAVSLALGNSSFNPFIYAFRSSQFKKAYRDVLCC